MPRQRDPDRALSPIANYLQEFMWDQRPNWTRPQLSEALGVPRTTVDGWFLHERTAPKAAALYAIARVTNTPIEQVAALAGYKEVPPEPDAGVWGYLLREIDAEPSAWTPGERGKLVQWLTAVRAKYEQPGVRAPVGRMTRGRTSDVAR